MRIRKMSVALYLVFFAYIGAFGQDEPPKIITSGPPVSLAQSLKERHVELTEAGLLKALRSPNAEVRYLAALRLAEEKDLDVIPAIERALSAEKVPETRINIAIA